MRLQLKINNQGKSRWKNPNNIFTTKSVSELSGTEINERDYIELQIGYYKDENILSIDNPLYDKTFLSASGKNVFFYELSEMAGDLATNDINELIERISALNDENTFDITNPLEINQEYEVQYAGHSSSHYSISLPTIKFMISETIGISIIRKQQQYAHGTQAMLYLEIPLSRIVATTDLLGRKVTTKETANVDFEASEVSEIIFIFGTLSTSHKADVLSFLNKLIELND